MYNTVQAVFYDGKSANGESVKVFIYKDSLQIEFDRSRHDSVTFSSEKLTDVEFYSDSAEIEFHSRYKKLFGKLIIKDPEGIKYLKELLENKKSQGILSMLKNPGQHSVLKILNYTVPLIILFASLFIVIIFNIYRIVPISVDEGLGEIAFSQFMTQSEVCENKQLNGILTDMAERLVPEDYKYNIDVTIVKSEIVNAISLPGGKIIFFSGLLETSETPEEVAGIMAHELAHVYRRHGLQQVLRVSSISLLSAMFTGGTFEGLEVFETITEAGSTLLFLRYSRSFESEADLVAAEFLKNSHTDTGGLISFFQRLSRTEEFASEETEENQEALSDNSENKSDSDVSEDDADWFGIDDNADAADDRNDKMNAIFNHLEDWISTHPADEKRIDTLKQFVKENQYSARPILGKGVIWDKIKSSCD